MWIQIWRWVATWYVFHSCDSCLIARALKSSGSWTNLPRFIRTNTFAWFCFGLEDGDDERRKFGTPFEFREHRLFICCFGGFLQFVFLPLGSVRLLAILSHSLVWNGTTIKMATSVSPYDKRMWHDGSFNSSLLLNSSSIWCICALF